ncbi:MAG: DUF433 domain-containing protein [Deferribacteres bacterium]|nr:DUF433 domain-containing protein [Deferribacteres bacterium]
MATIQKSLRIPANILKEIEEIARETKRDFTTVTNELLKEAVRVRRSPGIVFTEGTNGKRARVAGTGIEVWEIIATYRSVDGSFSRLSRAYNWLTVQQLKAALGYYKLYKEEIDALIAENEGWTPEKISEKYPFL